MSERESTGSATGEDSSETATADCASETATADHTGRPAAGERASEPAAGDHASEPAAGDQPGEAAADIDLEDSRYYLNRELSELAFQRRVLNEAQDERNPLLERVRFLSIVTRNVDEFVMKRVGGLRQQIEAGITERTADGRTPKEQWIEVHDQLRPLLEAQTECYQESIRPALADAGIEILDYDEVTDAERAELREYFEDSILPTLTPLAFDPAHPFPFISNRSISLAVLTRRPGDDEVTFTRIKIPPNRPRLVTLIEGKRYVLVEDVIRANLDLLLPSVEIVDASVFRLTRNAEVRRNEEVAEDLIEAIEEVLEQRRFATGVRLEVEAGMDPRALETLQTQLDLDDREVYELDGPIDYREFDALLDLDRPDIASEPWTPQPHPGLRDDSRLLESDAAGTGSGKTLAGDASRGRSSDEYGRLNGAGVTEGATEGSADGTATDQAVTGEMATGSTATGETATGETTPPETVAAEISPVPVASGDDDTDVFAKIRERDRLLHHPYHDFSATVQRFIEEAADDPQVLAVKAAIYRTASDSEIIEALIDAAENGKQVAVMVELKARFDEQNNLEWVRTLEEHGIHVAYGTIGLKTHTKTAMVVREEADGVRLYSHVGTGNYHSETAKGYVDLGLLTADPDVGQDLAKVFNFFTGPALDESFRKLLIAPVTMREALTEAIRREARNARAGKPARIVAKVNALEDPAIVEELYRASMAGVDIDLIVRGICRLRPGLADVSENVSVYSLVGRFLEHSRIYYFENATGTNDSVATAEDDTPDDEGRNVDGDGDEDVRKGDGVEDGQHPDGEDGPRGEPLYYVGSADWMTRNLENRVEAVVPVEDPAIQRQLKYNLELIMADNRRVWEMQPDGSYVQRRPADGERVIDTQAVLMEDARRAAQDVGGELGMPGPYPVDGDLRVADDERGAATAAATSEADGGLPFSLVDRPDVWYEPDSDHYGYAVVDPSGTRHYRKTPDGAAAVIERFYE